MTGAAACRGAVTIVNAIAIGKGAAFGITLEADAEVRIEETPSGFVLDGPEEGFALVKGCVDAVCRRALRGNAGANARIRSEIPISKGLKSSSAVSNAAVLATGRALGLALSDSDILDIGVEESVKAGVTLTGAFDDASACLRGGVVVTDNRNRLLLHRGSMDNELVVVIHAPDRQIPKSSLKSLDFTGIRKDVEAAFALALKGQYLAAMDLNSRAYARILDVSEEAVEVSRKSGALAAGITGTGPATAALCKRADASRVAEALRDLDGDVIFSELNATPAREVRPRLL
jgi:shikimate kinase